MKNGKRINEIKGEGHNRSIYDEYARRIERIDERNELGKDLAG